MKKIDAYPKTVYELLNGVKYTVDFYQREYKWEKRHIEDLLRDLETTFLIYYDEDNEDNIERNEVQKYGYYFLGSIVTTQKNGIKYVVDGQQRLTSLILLFIYLRNLQKNQGRSDEVNVDNLIFSEKFAIKSFNFEDPDDIWRKQCMEALYYGGEFDIKDKSETIQNIVERYNNIGDLFNESLHGKALPFFIEWLMYKVELIEIIAATNDDAYTVFETMNDRGLSLKPVEMLKGYLLSNIQDPIQRKTANTLWKNRILELNDFDKEEDSNFVKTWFRAKFAISMRERKKHALNKDFERIGNEFHKWLREQQNKLKLKESQDFIDFIMKKFNIFSRYYLLIREAAEKFSPDFEYIYYNAQNNFTLQYPLILAPIKVEDEEETILKKIKLVSAFIDMFIARRVVNYRTLRYSSIQYTMFRLITEIRDLDLEELHKVLDLKIKDMDETFDSVSKFKLHSQNRRFVHNLLSRMTYFIEKESKIVSNFETYVSRQIEKPYEIEHIWGKKYEQHKDEFIIEEEFLDYRQFFGNLILLPKGFNQSLGADTYDVKVKAYFGQNLLAKSLNELCYEKNPSFKTFLKESGLPFKPNKSFKKEDLDTRQQLYKKLCEYIWNPSRLKDI